MQLYAVDDADTVFCGIKIMNAHMTSNHSFLWNVIEQLFCEMTFFLQDNNTENNAPFSKSDMFSKNHKQCSAKYTPQWHK
jgi:hypothetical protein